jgi:dTDP-4-dehydrorhamnose reductase
MKCLIVGSEGQLGRALQATAPSGAVVVAPARNSCDLTNAEHIERWLSDVRPDLVFNAAAYTNVDAAESDPATADLVNGASVGELAEATTRHDARLVHISTDFVFDGKASKPYSPDDVPKPLGVYGRTKLKGEQEVQRAATDFLIVRSAWVYAEHGRNFVNTMLRLMSERDEIGVVADQIGTPTYARNLAHTLWALSARHASGIYHFTDEGVASWYDFAIAIQEEALNVGIFEREARIIPISTSDYPTPARRPQFSVLDKSKTKSATGEEGQHWRLALREMLQWLRLNG